MRLQDHGISIIEDSALFKLLPYVVRARDNGAIRAITNSWTNSRNRFARAVAEMAKIYDPTAAIRFRPSDFGESEELYLEYLGLARSSSRSTAEETRYQLLRETIPASVAAHLKEREALFAIAGSVGESLAMVSLGLNARGVLGTAIPRQHIKGSHSGFNAIGMVTGLFDIKTSELWSRYALKNPTDPASHENDPDFSYVPDQYPFLTATQYPKGNLSYDATILDDYPNEYEVTYQYCAPSLASPFWYNAQINGKNPFGYFPEFVQDQLVIGTYQLSGGGQNTRAFVQIPSVSGTAYVFESTTYGAHGNRIRVTITLDQFGSQTLKIKGPQSLIKFKTSMFDLDMAVDFERLAIYFPPILAQLNDSSSVLDGQVSRIAPDYPVTSSGAAFTISSPEGNPPNYQIDMETYLEVLAVVRQLVEASRPMTRTVRREFNGFSVRDQVLYAPVHIVNEVTLGGGNKLWRLRVVAGIASFTEVESGEITKVYQRDAKTGFAYQWGVDQLGRWSPRLITNAEFAVKSRVVVMLGRIRVLIENSHLLAKPQETAFQDEIHTDGTSTESNLREQYSKLVENPADVLIPYMSADAVSSDEPEDLVFQPSPEDELNIIPTLVDFASTHIDPHAGTEEDLGAGGGNWYYTPSGQLVSQDIRLRSAGIQGGLIEPVPTGALTYGYPIRFLNYHNVVAWRNRITNEPFSGLYTYDSPDETTGATLQVTALLTDGPIEGSNTVSVGNPQLISSTGDGATPNAQVPVGFTIDLLVLARMDRRYDAHANYFSVSSGTDGNARFNFRATQDFQVGNKVYLPLSSAYMGVRAVSAVGPLWFEIPVAFSATETGSFTKLIGEMLMMSGQTVTAEVKKDTNLGVSSVVVFHRQPGSSSYTFTEVYSLTDNEGSFEFTALEAHEALFFASGRSSFRLRVLAPDNSLEGLPGTLTTNNSRVDVGLTLLSSDDERFWDYDQGDGSPNIEVDGITTWRGGTWRGSNTYEADNSDRFEMPGVLLHVITITPTSVDQLDLDVAITPVEFEAESDSAVTWAVIFGSLPTGLSLDEEGVLTGTPVTPGNFTFGLRATNELGETATVAITIVVYGANMVMAPAELDPAELDQAYSVNITVTGGVAPYALELDGTLPVGFTGVQVGDDVFRITGTADPDLTQFGDYNFSIDVEDDQGIPYTQGFTLIVSEPAEPAFSAPSGIFVLSVDS